METCCICLEDDTCLITPKYCLCKVYLHEQCYNIILKNNMACPICRIAPIITNPIIINNNYQKIINFADNIFKYPMMLFQKIPNVFTFLLCIICSILIFTLFITPFVIIEYLKNTCIKHVNIKYLILDIVVISCIFMYYS
jgi:hypothetical protein